MHWWISFTNNLPPSDCSRIKRSVRLALAGGMHNTHRSQSRSPVRTPASPLRGGKKTRRVRHFFRTNRAGKPVSSAPFTLAPTSTPIQLVHHMFTAADRSRRSPPHGGGGVPTVTRDFVRRSTLSPRTQERYLRAYAGDRAHARAGKTVVYLREKGKNRVREYDVGYQMIRFPTRHNITHGTTRNLIVNYVQSHKCA